MNARTVSELSVIVAFFPSIPFAGLVAEPDRVGAVLGAQMLGNAGVRILIDSRARGGWSSLRETLDRPCLPDPFIRDALASVLADLEVDEAGVTVPCTDGCRRFFQAVFAPETTVASDIARRLGVQSSTLTSRFARAGLPSPKQYLSAARLVWAAYLGESPALTISAISMRLCASTPQSFGRTIRGRLGMTATEFRHRFTGQRMLDQFLQTLVIPFRNTIRAFDPVLGNGRRIHAAGSTKLGQEVLPCR